MEGKFVLCENLDYLFLVRLEVESLNLMKDKYLNLGNLDIKSSSGMAIILK